MPTYIVTRKVDGVVVHPGYSADAPIEWYGMEFATHDHTSVPEPAPAPTPPALGITLTKLEYLRRFTQPERIRIRDAAAVNAQLADYMQLLELATEVRTDDPDTIAAVQMLEAAGLIGAGRAQEILNG